MKVLCWNMGAAYGPYREPAAHDRAWHWVAAVDPDLALLQETNAPAWVRENWTVHDEPHEFWASAIVARRGLNVQPIAFEPSSALGRFGSYLATAELLVADGSSLLVASVHTRATVASARGTHGLDRVAISRPSASGLAGILVTDGAGGEFRSNDLRGNAGGSWKLDEPGELERTGNLEDTGAPPDAARHDPPAPGPHLVN